MSATQRAAETAGDTGASQDGPSRLRRWVGTIRTHPEWWVLGLVVLAGTAARIAMCAVGPDLDSDSYGHAVAGRRMLSSPGRLGVHWVWLPLLHVLYAVSTLLGLGIQGVRGLNVVVSATVPIALAMLLHRHLGRHPARNVVERAERAVVPTLAGALVLLEPTSLHMGSTGQTEPLFQALVVLSCLAWGLRANVSTAVLLGLACLTRYEAWLLPPVLLVLWWFERPRAVRRLLPVIVAAGVIALWCVLQYLETGRPLHFLRLNDEFVRQYFQEVGYVWGSDSAAIASRYAFFVPRHVMYGPIYWLAPLGAWWMLRRGQPALLWVSVVLLAFVTWGLFTRKHLGLDRHAVALVPAYATAMAGGLHLALVLGWRGRLARWASIRVVASSLALVLVVGIALDRSWPRVEWQLQEQRVRYASASAAAEVLRGTRGAELILCDVAEVEALSNLPPWGFRSGSVASVTPDQLRQAVDRHGTVLAVSVPSRLEQLGMLGELLYADQWTVVVRFDRDTIRRPAPPGPP